MKVTIRRSDFKSFVSQRSVLVSGNVFHASLTFTYQIILQHVSVR
jgi:hypothetical protein